MPAIQLSLRRGATSGTCIMVAALLATTPSANAQTGVSDGGGDSTADSASPGEDEETPQQLPAAVSIVYPESNKKKKPEPEETGIYSKKVQGKLWLEGFIGPSSYDPDRFGVETLFPLVVNDLEAPKVKGPEFGGAFGGAIADQIFFIGASYRQANYEIGGGLGGYKLMKVGVDMQVAVTLVPYVHPLIRFGLGYARIFGGNASALDLKTNGAYLMLGAGVRVPIVRWVSFVATFDWSRVTIAPKGGGVSVNGQQFGGTFGLTLHFVGVKK